MVETGTISSAIEECILPALATMNSDLKELDRSQEDMKKAVERINAEAQVLVQILDCQKPATEYSDSLNSLRRRIARIHRRLELISSRLTQL